MAQCGAPVQVADFLEDASVDDALHAFTAKLQQSEESAKQAMTSETEHMKALVQSYQARQLAASRSNSQRPASRGQEQQQRARVTQVCTFHATPANVGAFDMLSQDTCTYMCSASIHARQTQDVPDVHVSAQCAWHVCALQARSLEVALVMQGRGRRGCRRRCPFFGCSCLQCFFLLLWLVWTAISSPWGIIAGVSIHDFKAGRRAEHRARAWKSAPAQIRRVAKHEFSGEYAPPSYINITYVYTWRNQEHIGRRVTVAGYTEGEFQRDTRKGKLSWYDTYRQAQRRNKTLTAYVNPQDSSVAVLNRRVLTSRSFVAVQGLFILVSAASILFGTCCVGCFCAQR